MSRMPSCYKPPLGLPFNWRDEMSGVLPLAVERYYGSRIGGVPLHRREIELLTDYLEHYINAPCWDGAAEGSEEMARTLAELREEVKGLETADDIGTWISKGMDIGLSPF